MNPAFRYGRVLGFNPGKHGLKDWRVQIGPVIPTLAETAAAVGITLLAEDRYDKPWQNGRHFFWEHIEQLHFAHSAAQVEDIVRACDLSVSERRQMRRPIAAVAVICRACGRDMVYVNVQRTTIHPTRTGYELVAWASQWFGCDCVDGKRLVRDDTWDLVADGESDEERLEFWDGKPFPRP